jgi:hypothetical protein
MSVENQAAKRLQTQLDCWIPDTFDPRPIASQKPVPPMKTAIAQAATTAGTPIAMKPPDMTSQCHRR